MGQYNNKKIQTTAVERRQTVECHNKNIIVHDHQVSMSAPNVFCFHKFVICVLESMSN